MEQSLYVKLYENRLLESTEEIFTFEECLERLSEDFKEDDIIELCQVLDDNTMEFETMFSVIHLLETLSSEQAFLNTIKGVVKIKNQSPVWAKTITYRCLNDLFSIEMLNKIIPRLEEKNKADFRDLLLEIRNEDEQKFGDAIKKVKI